MTPTPSIERSDLLTRGLPIVQRVARRVARRIPSHVELGDLVGAGAEGLLKAVQAYDPARSDRFEPYAEARIRGAILDELRAGDVMTQHGRRRLAAVQRASTELERELGRAPSPEEIAAAAGTTVESYRELLATSSHATGMTLGAEPDPDLVASSAPDPGTLYVAAEERRRLAAAIASLPPRMQEVLSLYYQHECTQTEIGRLLSVTESRICQILSEATARLRFVLADGSRQATAAPRRVGGSSRAR